MALSLSQTEAVRRLIRPGMKVSSLGYPDIIAPIEMAGLEYRSDSDAICMRHGLQLHPIPDAHSFFKLLGAELDVYDIVQERGSEILCDLNRPMVPRGTYDIVLDVGTAEHCFNIGRAMINMASMVKEGGWIIHENPANWGNHGFYNLNPTLFVDFYDQNGFQVEELALVTRDGHRYQVPPVQRFRFPNEEVNIFFLAKRTKIQTFQFPVQSKYKKLIPAAGVPGESTPDNRAVEKIDG